MNNFARNMQMLHILGGMRPEAAYVVALWDAFFVKYSMWVGVWYGDGPNRPTTQDVEKAIVLASVAFLK